MGNKTIEEQLRSLGYEPVFYNNNDSFIGFKFIIPHGKFKDKEVEIAIQAPQFPDVPPSGPHIKPFLLPFKPEAGIHPYHGIHDRKVPTADFQYWSRPVSNWDLTERNMKVYLSFLRTLFDFNDKV